MTAWLGFCGLAAATWLLPGPTAAWLTPIGLLTVGAAGVIIVRDDRDPLGAPVVAWFLVASVGISITLGLRLGESLSALG